MKKKYVLVACEESQVVCKAFRERGFIAFSCDIQECSGGYPQWHIKQDVIPLLNGNCTFITSDNVQHNLNGKWDLIIAHPPCTYLSVAGARHLYKGSLLNVERYNKGLQAKDFFLRIYNCSCEHICVENPLPFKIFSLPPCSQVVQPFYFGHPFKKRTLLWLKGLPLLKPTDILDNAVSTRNAAWFNNGGKERQKNRSKTFTGIAAAMVEQWGNLI